MPLPYTPSSILFIYQWFSHRYRWPSDGTGYHITYDIFFVSFSIIFCGIECAVHSFVYVAQLWFFCSWINHYSRNIFPINISLVLRPWAVCRHFWDNNSDLYPEKCNCLKNIPIKKNKSRMTLWFWHEDTTSLLGKRLEVNGGFAIVNAFVKVIRVSVLKRANLAHPKHAF